MMHNLPNGQIAGCFAPEIATLKGINWTPEIWKKMQINSEINMLDSFTRFYMFQGTISSLLRQVDHVVKQTM